MRYRRDGGGPKRPAVGPDVPARSGGRLPGSFAAKRRGWPLYSGDAAAMMLTGMASAAFNQVCALIAKGGL
jgi:hypothetical protein